MLHHRTVLALLGASVLVLSACTQQAGNPDGALNMSEDQRPLNLMDYPLQRVLTCLPEKNALVAAHRGTSRDWDIPENSLQALGRLLEMGTLMAEIDVIGLKSGEQVLFHDGVWDKKSTGKGPVASSTYADVEKMLLKSFAGTLSVERPPLLSDALRLTKDKMFLEVDFKSSAKTDKVLEMIRANDMADQVVLIAYTQERAEELHALAPEMIISAPGDEKGRNLSPEKTLLWMGRNVDKATEPTDTLGYIGLIGRGDDPVAMAEPALFLVSDYPTELPQIIGGGDKSKMRACLEKG
jgi:glycerophosphoryl diester phosphodiesterase